MIKAHYITKIAKRVLLVLVSIALFAMTIACGEAQTYQTSDIKEYLQIGGHIENEGLDINSGLFIFPESISDSNESEYEYYCKQGIVGNSYMIYLKSQYPDDTTYQAELDRLGEIKCSVRTLEGTVVNEIEYTTDLFDYPAYVTIYNTNGSFEYALADDDNKCVTYIYLKMCEGSEFLPEECLPTEFKNQSMMQYDMSWTNQNIYYASEKNGDHVYYLDD